MTAKKKLPIGVQSFFGTPARLSGIRATRWGAWLPNHLSEFCSQTSVKRRNAVVRQANTAT